MKRILAVCSVFLATVGLIGGLAFAAPVGAIDITESGKEDDAKKALTNEANAKDTVPVVVGRVITTVLFILGMAAVLIIILAGFRYVTANGDAGQIKTARNAILYACIGLIVAILSYAIVEFILSSFSGGTTKS